MASRIVHGVSATPIYTATNAEMNSTDVIAKDVGQTVSGGGSTTVTWGSTYGVAAGVFTYYSADQGGTGHAITMSSAKFLYIKNTGYLYSSDSVLGAATTTPIIVYHGAVGDNKVIAVLGAGQAIVLPYEAANSAVFSLATGTTDAVAFIYFWTA